MNEIKQSCNIDVRGIATVTLNNGDRHNAFDDKMIEELSDIFRALGEDATVRVVVLEAEGKSFSAGADLAWMKRMSGYSREENYADAEKLAEMLHLLYSLDKPTIARVQGAAFGGGVGLVSCCDIAIASLRASFSFSEVKLGLVPATISPYVIAAIGPHAARRYFSTAERFDAETALRLGLVSEVVEEQALDERIETIATCILANGPKAVAIAKQLVADVQYQSIDANLRRRTSELIANVRSSEEGREGLGAFLEKRHPAWILAGRTGA
ncbi:MAG: enoyl-CoA hydratase/isomerase family protein [Pseudomonadales bacterium]|nr:enoyl-CoA hydratase/isomerase family protein [Pseudomonadales bacterium]